MNWTDGPIDGCSVRSLEFHADERGWLSELFRVDDLDSEVHPVMGYLSLTHPGVIRGPHEHEEQTDLFVLFDGCFRVKLWDAREDAETYGNQRVLRTGRDNPIQLLIPPGVVHAYKNIGHEDALLINCPNRLYAGWNRQHEVDEIRHEEEPSSPYVMT